MLTTNAQGHEHTRNTSERLNQLIHRNGDESRMLISPGMQKRSTASVNTSGVYQRVILRSIFSVGDFVACADSINFIILLKDESENAFRVLISTTRSTGIMPDEISSPGL